MPKTRLEDLPILRDLTETECAKIAGGNGGEWKYVPVRRDLAFAGESDGPEEALEIAG